MTIFVPSIRQLCYALIGGIASHPLIQDPPIYYPVLTPNKKERQQIKINKYRTYGGIELLNVTNEGLTCAVYPAYVPRNTKTGHPSTERDSQKSISYSPYELGKVSPNNSVLEKVTFKLVVELHYHDVAISNGVDTINFAKANPYITNALNKIPSDNYNYLYIEKDKEFVEPLDSYTIDNFVNKNISNESNSVFSNLQIDINPGEEILRDYMELLRIVINQLTLQPFKTKSLQVKNIDFPTSNWLEDSKNVYFHMAYLIVDIELYLPSTNYLFSSPEVVSSINLT